MIPLVNVIYSWNIEISHELKFLGKTFKKKKYLHIISEYVNGLVELRKMDCLHRAGLYLFHNYVYAIFF